MTSLNSSGVHITVFRLPEKDKELFLHCLDEKTDAPRWPACEYSKLSNSCRKVEEGTDESPKSITGPNLSSAQQIKFKTCLSKACEEIMEKEKFINELDSGCGDGDCGSTLKNLALGKFLEIIIQHVCNINFRRDCKIFREVNFVSSCLTAIRIGRNRRRSHGRNIWCSL